MIDFLRSSPAVSLDARINDLVQPLTTALSSFIFFSVDVGGASVPLIVVWLMAGSLFFTVYLRFINLRGFLHAVKLVWPKRSHSQAEGEVSHFQALSVALSGTVGIGNIAGVAVTLSLGGPGATFWLIIAGLISMTTKFVECTLGVKYREIDDKGVVSGGPMYYLQRGLARRGMPRIGRVLGIFFAASIVVGCLGIGNMFQSNQAAAQIYTLSGGAGGALEGRNWITGCVLALIVGLVIVGGMRRIARIADKIVPLMIVAYVTGALAIVLMNITRLPWAISTIATQAFSPEGVAGGVVGVMILGFQRAVFSNEAGLGSASIAHSAVRTSEPLTEGFVALLEPFIDTVLICTLTGLVLVLVLDQETIMGGGLAGIELTSLAFETAIHGSSYPLSAVAFLFAFSTMIAWAYYGQRGWIYLFGRGAIKLQAFNLVFCLFIIVGATIKLGAVLDFADAIIYVMALPNILGLYMMASEVRHDLNDYWARRDSS
ncbi:alanine/glycine:cation symporter family protein [Hyphomonas sp. NPDC076881]